MEYSKSGHRVAVDIGVVFVFKSSLLTLKLGSTTVTVFVTETV